MELEVLPERQGLRELIERARLTKAMRMWLCARLFCETDVEAARFVGIAENTCRQWKQREDFRAICDMTEMLPIEVTLSAIQYLAPKIVVVLDQLLEDANPSIRAQAVKLGAGLLGLEKKEAPRPPVAIIFQAREDAGLRPEQDIHALVVSGKSTQLIEADKGMQVGSRDGEGDILDMGGDTELPEMGEYREA